MGAHPSGLLGPDFSEDNRMMNQLMQVCLKQRESIKIPHTDSDGFYSDGTPTSDLVHVVDLARSHVAVLSK